MLGALSTSSNSRRLRSLKAAIRPELVHPPPLADAVQEHLVEHRDGRARHRHSLAQAQRAERVVHRRDVHLLRAAGDAGVAGGALPDEAAGQHGAALVGLHQPDELVRLEVAAVGHRAAAGALGALVAAHGRSPARGFHLAGQATAYLVDLDRHGGHFFSSDPDSTESFTALTLR